MADASSPTHSGTDIRAARQPTSSVGLLVGGGAIVAVLYFGREVLVPVLLAVLLSFVLAPIVSFLEKLRLGRVLSVLVVVLLAFSLIFALGGVMARQVNQLAASLPQYQATMEAKVKALRGFTAGSGTLEQAAAVLRGLSRALNDDGNPGATGTDPAAGALSSQVKPLPVEVHQPDPSVLETLTRILEPLIRPLTTTGIVFIFVIFILLQREDLRNRLIRLAGSHDLQRTTAAIDDAAHRLSRYFLVQVIVNSLYGVFAGIGLALIGVPTPVLWGIWAAIMRFVPYLGPFIAAAFPLTIAVAVDPGWSLILWTFLLFAATEPFLGQFIEPMVYGHSTGLSPVAVVLSATLWTALWGPVGLLVATPLTVCLVVLGRHVERLEFLDVILGDRPPLTPAQTFYQRILARDPEEAADHAEEFLKGRALDEYYDEVALKGLGLAHADFRRGTLAAPKVADMRGCVQILVDHLAEHVDRVDAGGGPHHRGEPVKKSPAGEHRDGVIPARWKQDGAILCVGGRTPLDEASAIILTQLLHRKGLGARHAPAETASPAGIGAIDPQRVAAIVLVYFDGNSAAHARYASRRLRRSLPTTKIVTCFWEHGVPAAASEAFDQAATSLRQAVSACLALAAAEAAHNPVEALGMTA